MLRSFQVGIYHKFHYCSDTHVHLAQLSLVEPLQACAANGVWAVGQGRGKGLELSQAIFVFFLQYFLVLGGFASNPLALVLLLLLFMVGPP